MRETGNAYDTILDAAAQLIAHEGVKQLTIERVAAEAGLSRGGVLYHFASKEALIQAMVRRMTDLFQQSLDAMMASDTEPNGRFTRAYIRLTLHPDATVGSAMGGLLAGLAFDPKLLAPLHAKLHEWQMQSESEIDPTTAAITRLVAHAFWTNNLLLPNHFSTEQWQVIVMRLEELIGISLSNSSSNE
jgi:AcrR family transcriptional regulator